VAARKSTSQLKWAALQRHFGDAECGAVKCNKIVMTSEYRDVTNAIVKVTLWQCLYFMHWHVRKIGPKNLQMSQ